MINPDGIYTEEYNIREYECDGKGLIKIKHLLWLIQQAGASQLDQLGLGYVKLLEENMVFLMSALEIIISRRPTAGDTVKISTCPIEPKGARFFRHSSISSASGEILVEAITSWLLVDPASRKIYRPSQFPYKLVSGTLEDDSFIKLKMPPLTPHSVKKVSYRDIDVNGHVNNAVYGEIALDCIPYELLQKSEVKSLNLQFKQECLPGENIELGIENSTPTVYYIGGSSGGTERFCARLTF